MAHYFLAVPHTDEKGWDTPDHLILRATFKVEEAELHPGRRAALRPLLPFFSSPVISSHVPSRASCRVKACVTAVSADDALSHPRENSQRLARRFAGIVTIWDWLGEEQFGQIRRCKRECLFTTRKYQFISLRSQVTLVD